MAEYAELIKALRLCQFGECGCGKCYYKELKGDWCTEDNHPEFFDCDDKLKLDAAAAIEELIESVHIRDKHLDELNHYIWKLEAEVKQLKECNDELREAQTYIDHYGDKWMTSAKDVPTSAYNHGYMDGKNEAEQALEPKRGKWITIRLNNGGSYTGCSCCEAPIPTDTMLDYIPESESKYCYSCGAKMNDSNASNALNALDNAQDGQIVTPCRGCSDYDGYGGCKSKGGCARARMEVQK